MTEHIRISDAGVSDLFSDLIRSITLADQRFRETHTGLPIEIIVADFAEHGPDLQLTEDMLRAYAGAVSAGTPFEWRLVS